MDNYSSSDPESREFFTLLDRLAATQTAVTLPVVADGISGLRDTATRAIEEAAGTGGSKKSVKSSAAKVAIAQTVSKSLNDALERRRKSALEAAGNSQGGDDGKPKKGDVCIRNGCNIEYVDDSSYLLPCWYHPGTPVFHEGYKFWSCCKKKTTEFDEFLEQKGCSLDKCIFTKPAVDETAVVKCRYDWIQTTSHVVITVYAKAIDPELSSFMANEDTLVLSLQFEDSKKFDLSLDLFSTIDAAESVCNLVSTKVDIKLKKREPVTWTDLISSVVSYGDDD